MLFSIDLSEIVQITDSVLGEIVRNERDVTLFLVALAITLPIFVIYRNSKHLDFIVEAGQKRFTYDKETFEKTPYEKLSKTSLEKIQSKLLNNYRILTTIYGVLLAFVIANRIDFALTSWSLIVWTGWILAVILRTGLTGTALSDINQIEKSLEKIRRKTYAAKKFLKHSFILFVFAIGFLPILFVSPSLDTEELEKLPWDVSISIFAAAFGIMGSFLVMYLVPLAAARFEVVGGAFNLYFYIILLIGLLVLGTFFDTPLEPIFLTLEGVGGIYLPTVFFTGIWISYIFSWIIFLMFAKGLIAIIYDSFKKSK